MNINTNELLHALKQEKELLERELGSVGRVNKSSPSDWEPSANELYTETAELEGRASEISDFEDRTAVEFELNRRYHEVVAAILRIETNTYGICRVCSSMIENDRLSANPAAQTCKNHRES